MNELNNIDKKIRETHRGYKLFDYIMAFFVLMALTSVAEFIFADRAELVTTGLVAVKELVIAFAFRAIRNLFKTTADVLDELRGTV